MPATGAHRRFPRGTTLTFAAVALAAAALVTAGPGAPRAAAAAGDPVSGLAAGPAAGQVTSGTTTPPPSSSSGWCLDNSGGSASAGNVIDIYQCNQTWDAQLWTAETDGTLRIQNMCLDVKGGGSANGTAVLLNTCNGSGSPGEQWQAQADGSLLNVNSHGGCTPSSTDACTRAVHPRRVLRRRRVVGPDLAERLSVHR